MARIGTVGREGVIHALISDRIDVLSQDPQKRYEFLKDLRNWKKDYFEILKIHGILKTSTEIRHYKQHWFNHEKKGWWKTHKQADRFEKIHRQGMIEAFEASVELDIPMETYWITGLKDFRVYICWSPRQITRLILSPSIPEMSAQESKTLTGKQPVRVVRYLNPELENVDKKDRVHPSEEFLYTQEADEGIGVMRLKGVPDNLLFD